MPAAIWRAGTSYGCCSARARFGRCFTPREGWGCSIRRRIAAGRERGGSELHALLWRILSCSWRLGSGRRGVWRGTEPHAQPCSATDCSAFAINYSFIMENRQRWLRGSGSSSRVAVACEGPVSPARAVCAPYSRGAVGSPPLAHCSAWPGRGQAEGRRPGLWAGDGSPGTCVGAQGPTPAPVQEGSLFLPRGQLAAR